MLGNKLLNIQFAKYHIWNNKSEGFPNMVLSTETFNQSVRTEYSKAVNARYTFQLLWVSGCNQRGACFLPSHNQHARELFLESIFVGIFVFLVLSMSNKNFSVAPTFKCGSHDEIDNENFFSDLRCVL